ncbi:uncharacterized protein E0L32_011796 [Thyridium curvatum]|uniref:F-box domain-containing protein n=1 Tax=Thyridium curvatum TaxID=1093900 RepID=A0A507BND2_9PEZI|nr:uncharacterized protein E0L32_011796 [Thyridium curvatum]TPX18298.1 hypothetical protein E0L32_011796 [Thyridium curvatum]
METQPDQTAPMVLDSIPAQANTTMKKKEKKNQRASPDVEDDVAVEPPSTKRPRLEHSEYPQSAIATTDETPPAPHKGTKTDDEPCLLLQLPQELLLRIMAAMDPEERYLFRQASRTAFYIEYYDRPDEDIDRDQVAKLLQADHLCDSCRRVREVVPVQAVKDDLVESLLYCSECQTKHSRIQFTAWQRSRPARERICISHIGRVRMCPHLSLGWEDIVYGRRCHPLHRIELTKCPYCNPKLVAQSAIMKTSSGPSDRNNSVKIQTWVRMFRHSRHEPIDLDTLKKLWRAFPRKETLSGIVCPHIDIESDQLLSCFGGYSCGCLGLPPEPCHGAPVPWCCACAKLGGNGEPGKLMDVLRDEEGFLHVNSMHRYRCGACRTWIRWARDGDWVMLWCEREMKTGNPSETEWLQAMDPGTWSSAKDEETKHLTWCPDASCAVGERWAFFRALLDQAERLRHGREGELKAFCGSDEEEQMHSRDCASEGDEDEEADARPLDPSRIPLVRLLFM